MREQDGEIIEGVLLCPQAQCLREHPIIDGIPIIVADIRAVIRHQLDAIYARDDLSPFMESLLGDCAGPESELERMRYQLSSYARGHFGDLDPDQPAARDDAVAGILDRAFAMLARPPSGVWLDLGCALGRASFETAARTGELVLGVDLNIAMLRAARRIVSTGRVVHPFRRVGLVYDRKDFAVELAGRRDVAFWACDVMALPLEDGRFSGVLSLNITDCVASPLTHLIEIGRVLAPAAEAIIATPYDWSVGATAVEGWIGGHSQRSEQHGSSVVEMRRILSGSLLHQLAPRLAIAAEVEAVPWRVYVHERATMSYDLHLMIARGLGPHGDSDAAPAGDSASAAEPRE